MEILSRLSAKNLLRCKCVSKRWTNLISDPSFVRIRHQRSRCILGFLVQEFKECGGNVSGGDFFLYARVNRELGIYNWMDKSFPQSTSVVMASCDGLICYRSRRTRHVEVPEIVVWTQWPRNGLPWDPLTVMLVTSLDWLSTHLVLLQRWSPVLKWSAFSIQNMTQIPSPLWSTHRRQGNGKLHLEVCYSKDELYENKHIYVNGRFYWLTSNQNIITFEVDEELSGAITVPGPKWFDGDVRLAWLGDSDGYLHYSCMDMSKLRVWMLTDPCKPTWVLKHHIKYRSIWWRIRGSLYPSCTDLSWNDWKKFCSGHSNFPWWSCVYDYTR